MQFKLVIFIAGNRKLSFSQLLNSKDETIFDSEHKHYREDLIHQTLSNLPKNVIYLENSGYTYKGIKIYGSPISVCRKESEGKSYKSRGFERKKYSREIIWS